MPRYFIDLHDGSQPVHDAEGFELPDLAAARGKVARIMAAIAQEIVPDVERQDYVASVRDAAGTIVYRARLSFVIEAVE